MALSPSFETNGRLAAARLRRAAQAARVRQLAAFIEVMSILLLDLV